MQNPLIEQHLNEGRLDQAESLALHTLDRMPHDVSAKCVLMRVTAERGRVGEAMAALEKLAAESGSAEPLGYLAHYLARTAENDETRAQALALARESNERGAGVPVADVLLADEARILGDLDRARLLYDAALGRNPRLVSAWVGRGLVLRARGELADAEDALANAVQFGPERVDAWVELIVLERDAGAVEAARENLTIAMRHHPGHAALLEIKEGFDGNREADDVDNALEDVRQRLRNQDVAGAQAVVTRLISGARDDPRTLLARAEIVVTADQGDIPALIHDLMRYVRRDPMSWEHKSILARVLLRTSVLQNPRLAAHYAEDAWKMSGEHPRAGLGLVEAWATVGKFAFARALCERLAMGDGIEAMAAAALLASGDDEDAPLGEASAEGAPQSDVPQGEDFDTEATATMTSE